MKIKSLLLSLMLFPAAIFGATNSFDNITVRVSEIGRGMHVWTNGVDGTVTNSFGGNSIFSRKTDDAFFDFISTNNIRVGRIGWDAVNNGINIGTSNIDLTFSENLGQLNLFSGNFTWLINNHTSSSGVTIAHNGEVGMFSNVTMGVFSGNTITINGTTVTAPNTLNFNSSTLWITNGGVAVGTNSMPATIAFLSQVNAATQIPLVGRGFVGQSADLLSLQSSTAGTLFSVSSAGTIDNITGNSSASLSSTALNLINNGGMANIINNSAVASSSLNIGGGTGIGAQVHISASGVTLASFSTNRIIFNRPVIIGTNGMAIDAVLIKKVTFNAPSIAATDTFTTNISLPGTLTNSMANPIVGISPTAGIVYQANIPSNDFANISMINITALPVDPANQTVGVNVHNDSITITP